MNQLKRFNTFQTTDASNLVKKTDYKTKINEIKNKTPDHDHKNLIS